MSSAGRASRAYLSIHSRARSPIRAMLETLYATAMRRMELANLKLYDIDADRGTVMIRQGKGKKDRHIPIRAGLRDG